MDHQSGNHGRQRTPSSSGQGKQVNKRGEGLNTGPIGTPGGHSGRKTTSGSSFRPTGGSSSGRRGVTRAAGGGGGLLLIIALIFFLTRGGLGGSGTGSNTGNATLPAQTQSNIPQQTQSAGTQTTHTYGSLLDFTTNGNTGTNTNASPLVVEAAGGSREKYTQIIGDGKDAVTIMVFMCGTDLESKNSMATSDLQEMINSRAGNKVNILVYTGGCKTWRNNVVSSDVNQIWRVQSGRLTCVEQNMGKGYMTDPATLTSFIDYCAKNYKANRYELIFWDHGGGSISGYGYDEKQRTSGGMTLDKIDKALADAGIKFDMIGFDCCLMGTLENAMMLADYADYLVASEETEPGIGWYYTKWLAAIEADTSLPTAEIGKQIVDDFVSTCATSCRGQKATLSVVDLAELSNTVPSALKAFSTATTKLIKGDNYKAVAQARAGAREFGSSSRLDQVDLIDMCDNLGTPESKALAAALRGAIKYNRTSSNMSRSYGLSIYFPYQRVSRVDSAVGTYKAIGFDTDYSDCIRAFASLEVTGQASTGGYTSPLSSLTGAGTGVDSADLFSSLLGGLLGGDMSGISSLVGGSTDFFDRSVVESAQTSMEGQLFDATDLTWKDGVLKLSEEQWDLLVNLELNVFVDDGEGYIDLGLDNYYTINDDGDLVGEYDGLWVAINGQPVAYYYETMDIEGDSYEITGRVPCYLNGERANLILVFSDETPEGYVAGARYDYLSGQTDTVAKNLAELQEGDVIDFVCDYYTYDGRYENSYYLGDDSLTVSGPLTVTNEYIEGDLNVSYRLTDIYNQHYWTEPMEAAR